MTLSIFSNQNDSKICPHCRCYFPQTAPRVSPCSPREDEGLSQPWGPRWGRPRRAGSGQRDARIQPPTGPASSPSPGPRRRRPSRPCAELRSRRLAQALSPAAAAAGWRRRPGGVRPAVSRWRAAARRRRRRRRRWRPLTRPPARGSRAVCPCGAPGPARRPTGWPGRSACGGTPGERRRRVRFGSARAAAGKRAVCGGPGWGCAGGAAGAGPAG